MSYSVVVSENGLGRYQQEIIVNGRHRLLADEPEAAGGDDAGPAPFDFLMAGLGACTAMTLRMYAERKGLPVAGIRVELSHRQELADGHLQHCIERTIAVDGDLTPEQRQRMLDIANRCPVHRALTQPLRIATALAPK